MALKQSKQVAANRPVPTPVDGVSVMPIVVEYVVPAGGAAIGDVIEMGPLPNNCIVADGIVHNDAGTASSTLAWGLLSGNYGSLDGSRTCGNEFAAALSVATAGVNRLAKPQLAASPQDDLKGWGFVVAGAPLLAGQKIRAFLLVTPAPMGIA